MTTNDDFSRQIRTFSGFGYSAARIADILSLDREERMLMMFRINTPGDPYYLAFHSGEATTQQHIDTQLLKVAETGDIEAINLLEERKRELRLKDLRKSLFGI